MAISHGSSESRVKILTSWAVSKACASTQALYLLPVRAHSRATCVLIDRIILQDVKIIGVQPHSPSMDWFSALRLPCLITDCLWDSNCADDIVDVVDDKSHPRSHASSARVRHMLGSSLQTSQHDTWGWK